jgi:hypothetical protein
MDPRTIKMLEERRKAAAEAPPPKPKDFKTQATEWLEKNRTSVGAGTAVLIVGILAVQYVFVTAPARKQEQLEQQALVQEETTRAMEEGLQACLEKADTAYAADIDKACKAKREGANCSLPRITAEQIDQKRLDARIDCIKGYTPK